MPSCMTASHVRHASPAVPTSASASTCTLSKSTRYCVSDEIDISCVSVTPGRSGSTRKNVGPSAVRASTSSRSAAARERARAAWRRRAASRRRRPSAASCTPSGPNPPLRLQPRRRDDRLAGADRGQPLVALRVGAGGRRMHAGAHHRAHEVRRRRQRPPELLVDDHAVEHRHLAAAVLLGQRHAEQAELAELRPRTCPGSPTGSSSIARTTSSPQWRAHTPATASRSISCSGEKSRSIRVSSSPLSPRRGHGLSSGEVGIATRRARIRCRSSSPTRRVRSSSTQPQPASSTLTLRDRAVDHHRVAGEDRLAHLEAQPPEAPLRPGPVGDEALEPRALVGRVQEDVAARPGARPRSGGRGASAASRAPPSAPSTTVVDGDVVGQRRQRVADRAPRRATTSTWSRGRLRIGLLVGSRGSRSRSTSRRRTSSPCWLRYSTSITQNRPVPSRRSSSSLTDTRMLRARDAVAGADRLVERGDVLGHDRLGQLEARLQVEVDLQRQLLDSARPGAQWWGRNHAESSDERRDRAVGELVRRRRRPRTAGCRSRPTTRSPEVAALHGELAFLLVLELADQRRARRAGARRVVMDSVTRSLLHHGASRSSSSVTPAARSSVVGVGHGRVAHLVGAGGRGGVPAKIGPDLAERRRGRGACASTNALRAANCSSSTTSGTVSTGCHAGVGGDEVGDPVVEVAA